MATVTKSIGTSSRDYSTITAWEADLDNASIYSSGDTAKGECYDDSDFTESTLLTFNGGTTVELDKMLLTVPVGQRHDGTAGSGAQVNFAAGACWRLFYGPASGGGDFPMERTVEWLELNGAGNSHTQQYALQLEVGGTKHYYGQVNHLLVHDFNHTDNHNWEAIDIPSSHSGVHNCIVYDCQGVYNCIGLHCRDSDIVAVNNTVYKMKSTQTGSSDNKGIGIWFNAATPTANKNNIAMGSEAVGTQADFYSNVGTYNLSSDATATGSNSVASQATANIFISTTNGSEDLHILRSSNAVGAGEDLGTGIAMGSIMAGSSTYGTPLNRDINNGDRNSRAMAWDIGASQNAIISTIGTSSRDYSTVAAWTADLDEDTYYGAGSVARGECYADTAFTACHLENGGTIGLVQVVLTAADGQQHDGTAGTGVVFNMAGEVNRASSGSVDSVLSFLEFTQSSTYADHDAVDARTARFNVSHCLIHGYDLRQPNSSQICLLRQPAGSNGHSRSCHNNILYDLTRGIVGNRTQTLYGIRQDGAYAATTNNTVYNIHADSTDGTYTQNAIGIEFERATSHRCKNNIAMGLSSANGTTTGMVCTQGTPNHANNNMVNDTSAGAGTSSQTGKSSSGQFVSTTTGSEDFHLVTGSDAIGNGEDLGLFTDATGFAPYPGNYVGLSWYVWGQNYDINRGNRHAFSQTWDIGASQHSIISTVGTSSRDYSTVAAWIADLDDDTYYGAGSVARGECYADSTFTFTGVTTISGGDTIDLVCKVLTAADDQRHDGTASGTHVKFSSNARFQDSGVPTILSWLDISWTGTATSYEALRYINVVDHCLIHDVTLNYTGVTWRQAGLLCNQVHNNIIYDINRTEDNNYPLYGIFCDASYKMANNNTVYNVNSAGDGATTYGIYMNFYWDNAAQLSNNIVMGTTNSGTGSTVLDIKAAAGSSSLFKTNMSSDAGSSVGTDGLTSKSAANQFVSTVNDSQDFHLVLNSDAIGAGTDLGVGYKDPYGTGFHNYYGYDFYSTGWQYDINYGNRDAFSQTWDIGASQYAIISTIGTNSRDYSTITAWEADLDDASYYGKGSVANGQMYKDSDYQYHSSFTQNGGGTLNLFATYLTVAEGQRHDGTANTGVRFLNNGSYQWNCMIVALWHGDNPVVKSFEWVEMDLNGKGGGGCTYVLQNACGGWGQSSMCSFNHCMIHNYYMGNMSAGDKRGVIWCYSQYTQVHNNLLFNIKAGNPSGSNPFLGNLFGITSVRTAMMANNTIYGLKHVDSTSGEAMGIQTGGTYNTQEVYNNICVGNETQDFHDWGSGAAVHSHNLSSDSSATGTGAVTDKSAASLFVSTTVGSEDLHLIDGAGALRVGKDLGTKVTFGGVNYGGEGTCLTHVNIDIDGRNRDSQGDDWDIGADQCDSCSEGGATGSPAFLLFLDP